MENQVWENRERRRELIGEILEVLTMLNLCSDSDIYDVQVRFHKYLTEYPWLKLGWEEFV